MEEEGKGLTALGGGDLVLSEGTATVTAAAAVAAATITTIVGATCSDYV
jgi:hypothetical protein